MATLRNHHDHWIDGGEQRLLLMAITLSAAILVMVALSPFALLFYW